MTAAGAVLNLTSQVPSSFPPAGNNIGLIPFSITVELDSTDVDHADDAILLFQFPSRAYLLNGDGLLVASFDDLDTGTPALEVDIAVGGVDGASDFLLISSASQDHAQAGGVATSSVIATSGVGAWLDVSNLYLQLIVRTAAATAADGDVTIAGFYTQNIVTPVVRSTNLPFTKDPIPFPQV